MPAIALPDGEFAWEDGPERYGLHKTGEVIRYTGKINPNQHHWGWGVPDELTETIAHVTSREAGIAVLRLFGVAEFMDFTRGRDWSDWQKMRRVGDG